MGRSLAGMWQRTFSAWRERARRLKRDTYALYLALKDPRVPWYARLLAGLVVAYAFSPIDLIPDFIPVLGYLDDLLIVPLGIVLTLRLIPPAVMARRPSPRRGRKRAGQAGQLGCGGGDRRRLAASRRAADRIPCSAFPPLIHTLRVTYGTLGLALSAALRL